MGEHKAANRRPKEERDGAWERRQGRASRMDLRVRAMINRNRRISDLLGLTIEADPAGLDEEGG